MARKKRRFPATLRLIGGLILGLALGLLGIPSPKWFAGIFCARMLCSASSGSMLEPLQQYCWACGLISAVFLIAGTILIIRVVREWGRAWKRLKRRKS